MQIQIDGQIDKYKYRYKAYWSSKYMYVYILNCTNIYKNRILKIVLYALSSKKSVPPENLAKHQVMKL